MTKIALLSLLLTFSSTLQLFCQDNQEQSSGILLDKANKNYLERNYDSAMVFYRKFISLRGNRFVEGEQGVLCSVYIQLANICLIRRDYMCAEKNYADALSLSGENKCMQAIVYQNLGGLHFIQEQFDKAILNYEEAWLIHSEYCNKDLNRESDILISLGTAYSENGNFRKSIACYQTADSVMRLSKNENISKEAVLNLDIAAVLLHLSSPEKAILRYRRALSLSENSQSGDFINKLPSLEGIAGCFASLGMADSAIIYFRKCLGIIDNSVNGADSERSGIWRKIGDVRYGLKDWHGSVEAYTLARELLIKGRTNVTDTLMNQEDPVLLDLCRSEEKLGKSKLQLGIALGNDSIALSQSWLYYKTALKSSGILNMKLGHGSSRLIFQESSKPILTGMIESEIMMKKFQKNSSFEGLFSIADALNHRILIEELEERRWLSLSGFPDSIVQKIKLLKDEIVNCSRRYISEDILPGRYLSHDQDNLKRQLVDLNARIDGLRRNIGLDNDHRSVNPVNNLAEDSRLITNYLGTHEALLEFIFADTVMYIFVAKSSGITLKKVALPIAFGPELHQCIVQLRTASVRNFTVLSHDLYHYLIEPVLTELEGINRLIIIPDEGMALLPFETLLVNEPEPFSAGGTQSWHYLVKDFEIIYHFSAGAWVRDQAMAIPGSDQVSFAGFAPEFSHTSWAGAPMDPLPGAQKEISGISGMFTDAGRKQVTFFGPSASEDNFRKHCSGKSHIHIATHSMISEGDPVSSALYFSSDHNNGHSGGSNDGALHLDEITNLEMNSSLVVLSACATGKGKITRTEGVLGLIRGFYVAGASNIIYSLWSIPDQFSCSMMLDFYHNYFSGKSYSASLREAKIKMIEQSATSLPYLWGGFVILGK